MTDGALDFSIQGTPLIRDISRIFSVGWRLGDHDVPDKRDPHDACARGVRSREGPSGILSAEGAGIEKPGPQRVFGACALYDQ